MGIVFFGLKKWALLTGSGMKGTSGSESGVGGRRLARVLDGRARPMGPGRVD